MVGGIVSLVTSITMFLGYDKAYTVQEDSSNSASDITKAATVQAAIKDDMMMGTLDGLITEVTLGSVWKEWLAWNAFKMLPDAEDLKDKKPKQGGNGGMKPKRP